VGLIELVVGASLAWSPASTGTASAAEPPATLERARTMRVEDASGQPIATVTVRPDTRTVLELPPGRYRLVEADGSRREVTVGDDGILVASAGPSGGPTARPTALAPVHATPRPDAKPATTRPRDPSRQLRWAAPLVATFIPGVGHAMARRPGAAVGIFAGAAALTFAAVATGIGGDPREGTAVGASGRSAAREVLRTGGFVLATDALALLWIGQIADAWVSATGKIVRARKQHVVALSLQRASAVGMRPGEPAIARYDDFTVAVMGQVFPRLSVGLADLGLHLGGLGRPVTLQVGARIAGRVLERDRFWLVVAGGAILQGTRGYASAPPDEGGNLRRERGRFGATLYAQLEARVFVLDRLSLDVAPRFSLPLATRYYGHDRAIPRWAPTLELVAGPTVYF
jgi:hypothetical protein